MDYTELVKSLRICGEWGTEMRIPGEASECDGCSYYDAEQDECKSWDMPWRKEHLLLDAADAIEKLQKDLERTKEYETFWEKEATEALKKFQVAVASKPQWIPVTERLPDEDGRYLVSYPLFNVKAWMRVAYFSTDLHHMDRYAFPGKRNKRPGFYYSDSEYGDIELDDVTHWMPLPSTEGLSET